MHIGSFFAFRRKPSKLTKAPLHGKHTLSWHVGIAYCRKTRLSPYSKCKRVVLYQT